MRLPRPRHHLSDAYRFPGFRPLQAVVGIFGDLRARVVTLVRRSKKNGLQGMRAHAPRLLRSDGTAGPRPPVWRHADPPGVPRAALESERVRAILDHLKRTGRLILGDTSATQRELLKSRR
jgi:hypothetical protein